MFRDADRKVLRSEPLLKKIKKHKKKKEMKEKIERRRFKGEKRRVTLLSLKFER